MRDAADDLDLHVTEVLFERLRQAGKPILHAPIFLEQAINAVNTVRVGAGLIAFPRGENHTLEQLGELLSNPRYTNS